MSDLKINFLSNLGGNIWVAVIGLVSVPFYIQFLGVEAYGLIGFYSVMQSVFLILDLGFSASVHREVARSVVSLHDYKIASLVRTLEYIYWIIGIILGLSIIFFSSLIGEHFLESTLPRTTLVNSIRLMGVLIVFRWPVAIYMGGLFGLQKQVQFQIVNSLAETVKAVGAILIFKNIKADVQYFYYWQIVVSAFSICILFYLFWRNFPAKYRIFDPRSIKSIWRFSFGVSGITLVSILLSQMDKIILAKVLTLTNFSYYMLAYSVSSALSRLSSPVAQSFYPRFVQGVASGNQEELSSLYHKSSQLMALMVIPASLVICLFAQDIMMLWTGSLETAIQTGPILSLMIVGFALNCLVTIPYHLQLAYGWTKLTFYQNVISLIILAPVLYIFAREFGAVGAAVIWVTLNLGYVLISQQIMHRKILRSEKLKWYWSDLFFPALIGSAIVLSARFLLTLGSDRWLNLFVLFSVFLLTGAAILMSVRLPRQAFLTFFRKKVLS